jgi:hypothetical protein
VRAQRYTTKRRVFESSEATIVSTTTPIINASRTMRQASSGPFNTFQLTSGAQILVNGSATGANVVELVYHQHTTFQYANRSTSDDWWYWNTSTSDFSAGTAGWCFFVISGVSLSATTFTQGATAGTTIATISVSMSPNAANDSFSTFTGGTLTLGGADAASFVISGSNLNVAAGHTLTGTSYNITVTAAIPVGGQNIAVKSIGPTNVLAQTLTSGTASEGSYPFLVGLQSQLMTTSYTSLVGLTPDFENDGSDGTYPLFDGQGTGTWAQWAQFGFPAILQSNTFGDSLPDKNTGLSHTTLNDPSAAAAGTYNSTYTNGIFNILGPYAQYVYCIRINWEWSGTTYMFSPFASTSIGNGSPSSPWYSASTFIRGWRQFVDTMRADSRWNNVKVCWDYPLGWGGGVDPLAYYPAWPTTDPTYGATSAAAGGSFYADKTRYVDIVTQDPYFGFFDDFNDRPNLTSAKSWTNRTTGSWSLTSLAQFAAARGKPIGFPEWGDGYSDGYCIDQFANWLKNTVPTLGTKCVFISYFNAGNQNSTDDPANGYMGDVNLCNPNKPIRLQHYKNQFGTAGLGTNGYTGTYWTHKANNGQRPAPFSAGL